MSSTIFRGIDQLVQFLILKIGWKVFKMVKKTSKRPLQDGRVCLRVSEYIQNEIEVQLIGMF